MNDFDVLALFLSQLYSCWSQGPLFGIIMQYADPMGLALV